jgi:sigma-B regulation protein RsbU (phosphoserine phosphatase)
MSNKGSSTTIFRQLILNVIFPVVVALLLLAFLNYRRTRNLLVESEQSKNQIISNEIKGILEFQDIALDIIESELNATLSGYSNRLVNHYFADTEGIEALDLEKIRKELGMNQNTEDIYVISSQGLVVNTTFEKDANLNFFEFGDEFKQFLLGILARRAFVSERFTIEGKTKRLKKYTYQSTNDGMYIVELGVYSSKADEVIEAIRNRLTEISSKQQNINAVDLYLGAENPFSLNKSAALSDDQRDLLLNVFSTKKNQKIMEVENGKTMSYEYIYMYRENTNLYKDAVIRIVSDKTAEIAFLRNELLKSILIFAAMIIAVIVLIFKKTQVITSPIKKLVDNVNRITDGNLHERATVEGNNEITTLSKQFNLMLEKLEELYTGLERKVAERTAEVVAQKEEIESQRDNLAEKNIRLETAYKEIEEQKKHITDSIHYAKRIQNAILPPDEYVKELLPQSFILYKPKDIVSGDFYWLSKKDDFTYFAAVDCTGHGVPGAFMSIVGNDQLNYAVNVKGARKASEILNELNKGVTNSLRQQRGVSNVKDGMDIALCAIDHQSETLQFAGAFNPLYHYRNGKLVITKGNKFPIGAFLEEDLQLFDNQEIPYQKGDRFYIFSDGYADQFGGPKGKKLKYKQFQEKLMEIHQKPMEEQKTILDAYIMEWMGELEQIDDILIIGLQI